MKVMFYEQTVLEKDTNNIEVGGEELPFEVTKAIDENFILANTETKTVTLTDAVFCRVRSSKKADIEVDTKTFEDIEFVVLTGKITAVKITAKDDDTEIRIMLAK